MFRTSLLLAVVICAYSGVSGSPTRADADPIRLNVYYETLCPDSQKFVKQQLRVAYPVLKDIMAVDIFAYGKASDTANGDGYDFECQHGPRECTGNMMLACAKNYITDQEAYVNFNICVMSAFDPPTTGQKCATSLGIDFEPISSCSVTSEGQRMLHDIGLATKALNPTLDYIPWMVVNDEHTDEIQQGAEFDLVAFICSEYQGTPLPDACSETGNVGV